MNVLMIISDQHQWRYLGHGGHPIVKTPNLDRLARQGVRFTNAYCQSPLCGPSRTSVMTGQYPHTHRTYTHGGFPLAADAHTLGTVFRNAGYRTGAMGKVHVLGETRERDLGFDERAMRLYTYNFEDYINAVGVDAVNRYATYRTRLPRFQTIYNPTNQPVDLHDEQMFDHLVVERCIKFMQNRNERPFFLWAGLEKPHTDWTAPAEFHAMYNPADMQMPPTVAERRTDMPWAWYASTRQSWCFDEDEIRHCMAAYCANVTYLDHQVGRLLDALDELGLTEETLVVYTSDHGEMCFDHGMVQKQNFFEESVRVPMIWRLPGRLPAGQVRIGPVELLDLFPTFCDLSNVTPPRGLEGRSLVPNLDGHDDLDRAVFSEYYEWGEPERMVRAGSWKYMHSARGPCQLYNLESDPHETRNLLSETSDSALLQRLRHLVMEGWEQPDMTSVPYSGAWNQIDEETHADVMEQWARTRKRVPYLGR